MNKLLVKACVCLTSFVAVAAEAEVFVDFGATAGDIEEVRIDVPAQTSSDSGLHLGVGVRRDIGERSSIGARLEIDDFDLETLLAVRAFDYAYHFSDRIAATAFFGAARLDLPTAAYGYYLGGGIRFKDVLPQWDLNLELRQGDEVARDNLLPSDPTPGFATFYDVTSVSLYLSRRF